MTEKEYREIVGESIKFRFLLDPQCTQNEYLYFAQKIADTCTKVLNTLRTETHFTELSIFTTDHKNINAPQISIFFQKGELYVGTYDQSTHAIYPYIKKEHLSSDNFTAQLNEIRNRTLRVSCMTPPSQTIHVASMALDMWNHHLSSWQTLEQKYRSEWQIVDQISPQNLKAYSLAKTLLDDHRAIYIESKNRNNHNTIYLTQSAKQILNIARVQGVFTPIYEEMRAEQIQNTLDKVGNVINEGTGIKDNVQKTEETRPTNIGRQ